jgi:hypothetical protein
MVGREIWATTYSVIGFVWRGADIAGTHLASGISYLEPPQVQSPIRNQQSAMAGGLEARLGLFFRPPAFLAQKRGKLALFCISVHRICALPASGRGLARLRQDGQGAAAFDHLGLFHIHSFSPIKLRIYHTRSRGAVKQKLRTRGVP